LQEVEKLAGLQEVENDTRVQCITAGSGRLVKWTGEPNATASKSGTSLHAANDLKTQVCAKPQTPRALNFPTARWP